MLYTYRFVVFVENVFNTCPKTDTFLSFGSSCNTVTSIKRTRASTSKTERYSNYTNINYIISHESTTLFSPLEI